MSDAQKHLLLQQRAIEDLRARIVAESCLSVTEARKRLGVSRSVLESYPVEVLPWHDATPASERSTRRYHPADVLAAPALLRAWMNAKGRGEGEAYLAKLRERLAARDKASIEVADRMSGGARRVRSLDFDYRGKDVPRDLFPNGRVKFSLAIDRDQDPRDKRGRARRQTMERLRRLHGWDVYRAIMDGRLHPATVEAAVQRNGDGALTELRGMLEAARVGAVPTFGAEAVTYLAWYAEHREPRSLRQMRSRLKRVGEQVVGENGETLDDLRLDRITKAHVEKAIAGLEGASGTQENARLAVSGLFRWSIGEEAERARTEKGRARWDTNPASMVEPKERGKRVTIASRAQVLALVAAAEIYQLAYLRSYAHLGLRLDELIHTRFHTDLDVVTWRWRIQKRGPDARCACPQCKDEGWSPKSKRGHRHFRVPAQPPQLRRAILDYLEAYPCEEGDFLFRNPRTNRIWDEGRLRVDFYRLCDRAGVKRGRGPAGGITPHTLRHTTATELLRAGVRESVVAALLGDTVQTIVNTYVHLDENDLAEAVERGPAYNVEGP